MNQPKVSIVVPCYNVARYIDRCVASIKAQTLSDYEVLFINDGSTDDTLTRLEQYADERRFRIFSFPNQGVAAARNEGIERARGEYLYFCDPDDEMMPTLLATAIGRLDSTNADAVHFSYRAVSAVTGEEQAAYTGNRLTVNECYSGGANRNALYASPHRVLHRRPAAIRPSRLLRRQGVGSRMAVCVSPLHGHGGRRALPRGRDDV